MILPLNIRTVTLFIRILLLTDTVFLQTKDMYSNDRLANKFFDERKYQLAIIEYERINHLYPYNDNYKFNKQRIAESYFLRGEKFEAINEYKSLIKIDSAHWESGYRIANIYQDLFYFYESNQFINETISNFTNSQKDTLLFLRAINYFALNNLNQAIHILNENSLIEDSQEAIAIITDYQKLNKKSPKVAYALNILFPGSGYFYLNLPQTGIATLFVVSLFGYATWTSADNGYTVGSAFGGVLFSGFYLGSVYGADQQAKKKKKLLLNKVVEKLKLVLAN